MTLSMLMATYFDVTIKALSGISCTLSDDHLNMYPWVQCSGSDPVFSVVAAISGVCLVMYTVGFPLVSAILLIRRRDQLDDSDVQRQLGFLFGGYRRGAYYWEFVVILRRLILALALTLVPFTADQIAVVVILVTLVSSVALQHTMSPFATVLENRLELVSLYGLLFSFLGIYVAENSVGTNVPMLWLTVMVVVIVAVTAVAVLVPVAAVLLVRLLPKLRTAFGGRLVVLERVAALAAAVGENSPLLRKETELRLSELGSFS
jgi:hypothetical protein